MQLLLKVFSSNFVMDLILCAPSKDFCMNFPTMLAPYQKSVTKVPIKKKLLMQQQQPQSSCFGDVKGQRECSWMLVDRSYIFPKPGFHLHGCGLVSLLVLPPHGECPCV
jgi:hypothetical protein